MIAEFLSILNLLDRQRHLLSSILYPCTAVPGTNVEWTKKKVYSLLCFHLLFFITQSLLLAKYARQLRNPFDQIASNFARAWFHTHPVRIALSIFTDVFYVLAKSFRKYLKKSKQQVREANRIFIFRNRVCYFLCDYWAQTEQQLDKE